MNGSHDSDAWAGFEAEELSSSDVDRLFAWSVRALPVAPLLIVGWLLGPQGVGFLSAGGLAAIDPAIPVALSALGVLVGLGLPVRQALVGRSGGIAFVGIGTAAVVAGGLRVASIVAADPARGDGWLIPLVAGICAATSLTLPIAHTGTAISYVRQIVERGVILPIIIGGFLLAWVAQATAAGAVLLILQGCGVAVLLASVAWLLLRKATTGTEQRVFVFAALLLIGGAADALALSALLVGLVAGAIWQSIGGLTRERVRADAAYVQHPLVALVLVVAGARAELSAPTFAFAAVYAGLRTVAHVVGIRLIRESARVSRKDLIPSVLSPGVFGIAYASDALHAGGPGMAPALSIVAIGTVIAEVLLHASVRRDGTP